MGDIADWLIDQELDHGGSWFRAPRCHGSAPRRITCIRCGQRDLWWAPRHNRSYEWYLVTKDGNPHVCNPMHDSEFEDLTRKD